MSVLIRGMDMPESCAECRLRSGSFGTFCAVLREYIDDARGLPKDKRMENCPLVEVKTPHGRLIDADLAMEKLAADKREAYTKHDVWLKFSTYGAPTVLEAEDEDDA